MYYSANEPQLKPRPPLIDKRKHNFVCRVKRKPTVAADLTSEFRHLSIGEHFRMVDAQGLSVAERAMALRKIAASSVDRNAQVVVSFNTRENPVGQIWTVDPLTKVVRVNLP